MMPGVPERRTHSYVRHGTTTLFAALDVASGFVIGKCCKRHRAVEFLTFLKEIDAQVPEGLDVHIVRMSRRDFRHTAICSALPNTVDMADKEDIAAVATTGPDPSPQEPSDFRWSDQAR